MKQLKKEYDFIISAIKFVLNGTAPDVSRFEDVDFEKVYRIASEHRIIGLIFPAVKELRSNIPETVFDKMRKVDKMMIMSSIARNNAIEEVRNKFDTDEIDHIFFKGAVLQNLYPEKYMRYSADTDVLVREKDYEKAKDIFKQLGYDFDSQNDKHYVFQNKPFVCVEVHKKLVSGEEFFLSVWDNTETSDGVYILKKEFELAYLTYHFARNLSQSAAMGIHAVTDVYLYLKQYGETLDSKLLMGYLEKLGLLKFFESIEKLGKIWFEDEEYDEFFIDLSEFIFKGGRSGNAVNAASSQIDPDKPLIVGKTSFFLKKLFLPYSQMKKIYPVLEKTPVLTPAFWAVRTCGLVFRPEHRSFARAKEIITQADKKSVENAKNILDQLEL